MEKLNLTEMEAKVYNDIKDNMDHYDDGYSDVGIEEVASVLGTTTKVARGVVGSLIKKKLIWVDEEYGIYYLENWKPSWMND